MRNGDNIIWDAPATLERGAGSFASHRRTLEDCVRLFMSYSHRTRQNLSISSHVDIGGELQGPYVLCPAEIEEVAVYLPARNNLQL